MVKTMERAVRKAAKGADVPALANALGGLVLLRLKRRKVAQINAKLGDISIPKGMSPEAAEAKPRAPRSTRRRSRNQLYKPTGKLNTARYGTWRHYMVATVCRCSSTWEAEVAHGQCEEPKFAKNRLDFSWCAANGYIDFV